MKKFKIELDDEEEYFEFICPICDDNFHIQSYLPIKVSILECNLCGFTNREDGRYI